MPLNLSERYQKNEPIIETVGATKVFEVPKQKITAVSDISMSINYEDFVMIFGPSGSGKSTLLNILLGLEVPDIGEVYLKNDSFFELTEEERAFIRLSRFGIIPQKQFWLNQLSVIDNVGLPLVLLGDTLNLSRKKAGFLLRKVGMYKFKMNAPKDLSVGQQQKVALARSLINDPWILFADEPTGNLDENSSKQVMKLLKEMHLKENITIVMVTHDLKYLSYAGRWLFVDDGKLTKLEAEDKNHPIESFKKLIKKIESKLKE